MNSTNTNIKRKFQDATFVSRNFIRKKLSWCCWTQKSNNNLWLYEQLNIAFLKDSAESLVSETCNMALRDSGCTKAGAT